jgi:hypothetical protein
MLVNRLSFLGSVYCIGDCLSERPIERVEPNDRFPVFLNDERLRWLTTMLKRGEFNIIEGEGPREFSNLVTAVQTESVDLRATRAPHM